MDCTLIPSMPFTFSHTAATLPFLHRTNAVGWRPALVFGSMAPDLLWPVPFFGERHHTHSLKGLLVLDIPFTILLVLVWVYFASGRISRMPGLAAMGRRDLEAFSWRAVLLGALIGSGSHVFWDLFTHAGSPLLNYTFFYRNLFQGSGGAVSMQSVMWYANSLGGLAVVAWWLRKKFHEQGKGVRKIFLSAVWLRVYAAFLLPYAFILLVATRGRVVHPGQFLINLSLLLDLVRLGMMVSLFSAVALIWWETRTSRRAVPVPEP